MSLSEGTRKVGRRKRGESGEQSTSSEKPIVWGGLTGGLYKPLSQIELERIHEAVLDVLETVGLADAPDFLADRLVEKGAAISGDGRLIFPRALVEDAITGFRRDIVLHGQVPGQELELAKGHVHMGSGGAAPSVIDLETGKYRPSTLKDLYDAARLVDALDNVHFFSRSVIARDMETARDLDVNTAYACLAGTKKHVAAAATEGENVRLIAEMCAWIAGSPAKFADQPFLSLNLNHVVPPLRFIPEACKVIEQAALYDIPFYVNSTGQAGASSPASLAGALVQSVVETLAGMLFAWTVNPRVQAVFGPRPLITDLRTGAVTGGCGEQAVVMAGAVQMANFYGLPNSCIAGATDAKVADAQSGHEKALTVSLAAHAGCNMITQACGMHAALMGCSFESYVVDNDMLGGILRSLRGIEANEANLATDVIAEVVRGEGHFLGTPDTYSRMKTDYLYPEISDRRSPDEWEDDDQPGSRDRGRQKAREILGTHFPDHIDAATDEVLRADFDIKLPANQMRSS